MGFEIDEYAFRKQNQGRPIAHLIRELLQNSLDENCRFCRVKLQEIDGGGLRLEVADGVKRGIRKIEEIWTIFASGKRDDPTKRGRLGRGLKELLSVVDHAFVATVGKTVEFSWQPDGKHFLRDIQPNDVTSGTTIICTLGYGKSKRKEIEQYLCSFVPPEGVTLTVNDREIVRPKLHKTLRATLKTVVYDDAGVQKESERATDVLLWEPRPGEQPAVFEMGIPVELLTDEDNFRWHLDISQRVPLRAERDRVSRTYMRALYAQILNQMVGELDKVDAHFIDEGLQSGKFDAEGAGKILIEKRFGEKVVRATSNLDDNISAERGGYTVVHTQTLSEGMREVMRQHTPSATEVAHPDFGSVGDWLKSSPEFVVPPAKYTDGEKDFITFAKRMAALLKLPIERIVISSQEVPPHVAHFTKRSNLVVVCRQGVAYMNGKGDFFSRTRMHDWVDLMIHEFGHRCGEGHDQYWHNELTRLGGQMIYVAEQLREEFPKTE